MHPVGTFTMKSLIVTAIVIASVSIFGPKMTTALSLAWHEGEVTFRATNLKKLDPSMTDDSAERTVRAMIMRAR